jgi:hypothetical protein
MSANGQRLVVITDRRFRIYKIDDKKNPVISLSCMGLFNDTGTDFKYLHQDGDVKSQTPLAIEKFQIGKFSCAAVSTEYLAIGCKGRMMIFTVEGEHGGRWVCDAIYDLNTIVEKVQFSADGRTLLVMVRTQANSTSGAQSKAHIYCTENISKVDIERQTPVPPIPEEPTLEWDWEMDAPAAVAFSGDGMSIAIATKTNAQGLAKIRLLKKVGTDWKYLGGRAVKVFASVERHGKGITGILL